MGMSSPLIAGQVLDITSDKRRQSPSLPPTSPSRSPSISGSLIRKDSGRINRTATIQLGSPSTYLVRKKLPWLNSDQLQKADQKTSTLSTTKQLLDSGTVPTAAVSAGELESERSSDAVLTNAAESRRASLAAFGMDPSLRAVGSTPSLRKQPKSGEMKRLSLNGDLRPGIKPITSRHHARQALGARTARSEDYTPSEYSTTPTSDRDSVRPGLSKKDPASYQRLVQKAVARKVQVHGPAHAVPQWFHAKADTSSSDISPAVVNRERRRASSCKSCELAMQEPLEVWKPSRPLRQATSFPPAPRPAQVGPAISQRAPPAPTLHAFPTHLMSPSSSSTDIPPHLMISTDESSASRVPTMKPHPSVSVSPRATAKPLAPSTLGANQVGREAENLKGAVGSFERLMNEAATVANDAVQHGRSEDVADILNSASAALRRSSNTVSNRRGRRNLPLNLSSHDSDASSSCGINHPDAEGSLAPDRGSIETAPTRFTNSAKSSQPVLVDPKWATGRQSIGNISLKRFDHRSRSPSHGSIASTPPRLYQPHSADSIVRDFAYGKLHNMKAQSAQSLGVPTGYGAAAEFYGDHGESVNTQPGIRRSIALERMRDPSFPVPPVKSHRFARRNAERKIRDLNKSSPGIPKSRRLTKCDLEELEHQPTKRIPATREWHNDRQRVEATIPPASPAPALEPKRRTRDRYHPHVSDFFENAHVPLPSSALFTSLTSNSYYRNPERDHDTNPLRKVSTVTDTRSVAPSHAPLAEKDDSSKPVRKHISLREGQGFSLGRYHRRQPIAREWNTLRKRIAAAVACINTVFIGLIAGIYAGEVPRIQYQIADIDHRVILGNVLLFVGLGLTTLIFWPLPLLHGRKPYTLIAFSIMLPLQFPQALAVSGYRDPNNPIYQCGLLIPRILTGMAMGFANINQLPTLFDLFGVSLMSEVPHQEIVMYDDIRRQGGGMGIWLGIWSWCFVGSLSIGFCIGACIIARLDPAWGFYIVVMLLAFFLLVNVISPETRRAPYRRSIAHFFEDDEKLRRRVARGEVKVHISNDGPKWWFQEVWAGVVLTKRMVCQAGYFVLMSYIAWIYAQVTLVILFLGALLSRDYQWQPQYVGLASLSVAIGAFLAMPLAKASLFSRSRYTPQRTDSMTMRAPRLIWSSHLVRRCLFTLLLPFAGLAYTLSAGGEPVSWVAPTVFCGMVGFLSNLAIAECVGLIMETFDTCDLQPGVNQKHRLQSMCENVRRRRTNYSSFPRVCSGFFAAQALGFFLAGAATGVSGHVTRALGAQEATAITAAILLGVTILLLLVLWRWKQVQVIPTSNFNSATKKGSVAWGVGADDPEWKPVIIGNPSGKMRRVNLLELGSMSRWTEIRRLNKLILK